ncbi:energy-coupling factor ABC transporter permease [Vogesella oryzae]|uniref:energy-coupling factor ABC transporter permease n=1 Tax=Vogesella oryzae TaxID=1735285 RepID=UPI001583717C|nr:energy-coupling factor ABC transporter permease [Vogesella oryzae]
MNFVAGQFPQWALWLGDVLALLLLGVALTQVRWRALEGGAVNAWLGACVLLLGFWLGRAGLQPGLSFHLLGGTVFTLLMGPALALPALAVVLLGLAAGGQLEWPALGLDYLLSLVPQVALTALLLRVAQRRLAANVFVYVFVNAFLAGAGGMLLAACCGLAALALAGAYPLEHLLENALPYYGLLAWSEAFTSGLVMAILIVYRPQWVATFDDARYLDRQ